jgi:hypothetical protein
MKGTQLTQQDQIWKAYRFFQKQFRTFGLETLEKLKQAVVDRLVLVSIVLDRDDNPHLIFESLNAKGRPLSQSDLIRNYFFMRIDVSNQENLYHTYWKPMQDDLGQDLTEFIRHFLMKEGVFVKQSDVYFALKERADSKRTQEEVKAYLQFLVRYAVYYAKLLRPDEEPNLSIRQRMHRLNRIEVTTAYPFLLKVYDDYAAGTVSAEEFQEILDVLENFLIRRFVCGMGTNQLNKLFPNLYLQASHNGNIADGVREFLRTKGYPRDAEFRDRLVSSKLYGAGDRIQKTKLILERLEASFGHKESIVMQDLTIEHVMPQTLSVWWAEHLGQGWEITHETLSDTLGNLTLTAYNSVLSNADIYHKSRVLGESHVELNKDFANVTAWNEVAIRQRADRLAERALQIWSYFGRESDVEESQEIEDVTGKTPAAVTILGERFPAKSWRDVAQITMETIATLDEERIEEILTQFPRLIGHDRSRFRSTRQLSNGLFIEVHMSAAAIYRFCVQAAELADLSSEHWYLELDDA